MHSSGLETKFYASFKYFAWHLSNAKTWDFSHLQLVGWSSHLYDMKTKWQVVEIKHKWKAPDLDLVDGHVLYFQAPK